MTASQAPQREKARKRAATARRALLSVSDKSGLIELARELVELGWELVASGGTGRTLQEAGLPFVQVESVTGNAEAFDGRMKTISFPLESAILYDRNNPKHVQEAKALGIVPIDMVVCNFYPFSQTVRGACSLAEAVEQIDVGGPTMVRAAAKNFDSVTVLCDPTDYAEVISEMRKDGATSMETRRKLAVKAFHRLALVDFEVAHYLEHGKSPKPAPASGLGFSWLLMLHEGRQLRYGENPHQQGFHFGMVDADQDPLSLHRFQQLQGKQMSYNNLLDADGALYALSLLGGAHAAAVIVKHTNPCGAAYGEYLQRAFLRAWEGDPLAAFGGIVAVNRPVGADTAKDLVTDRFVEVLLTPAVNEEAQAILASRKNMRVLTNAALLNPVPPRSLEYRSVRGGLLMQDADGAPLEVEALGYPTKRRPTAAQMGDLLMAWQIGRASRSNSITLVKDGMLVGNGVGQQDRLRSCRIAVDKAADRAKGAVAASDAFFPFADGPEVLAQAGVSAIIQPGGSMRDQETIDLCDRYDVAMVTSGGRRCFRH